MKLYVYGLAKNIAALTTPVSGISGAAVKLINLEGFTVLASEFAGDSTPVTRDNALAHDAVVRSVLDQATPLAFRFGTLVTEPQLAGYIATHRAGLEAKLAQVNGCLEMSVKIIWNTAEVEVGTESADLGPGAAFLQQKRREILGDERRAAEVKEIASWLSQQVGLLIREEQTVLTPAQKLIVAAAHLVERECMQAYRERLAEARKIRHELHFLVSGPWPPYSFSNIDLEFKTRFGVS